MWGTKLLPRLMLVSLNPKALTSVTSHRFIQRSTARSMIPCTVLQSSFSRAAADSTEADAFRTSMTTGSKAG